MGESSTLFRWRVAAFDGLRLVLGHAWSVLAWGLLAVAAVYGVVGIGYLLDLPWDTWVLFAANERFVAIALVPVGSAVAAVVCCAAYRAALTPEASAFAYMRLGRAELRMAGVFVVFAVAFFAISSLATHLGPWGFLPLAAAAALACRATFVAPGVFRGGRGALAEAWRLGGDWFWKLVALNLLVWVLFLLAIGAAHWVWYVFAERNYVALESAYELSTPLIAKLVLTSATVIVGYTAALVIAVTPAAVIHRHLTEEPDIDLETDEAFPDSPEPSA